MGIEPFVRLATPRVVNRPELPPDLAAFYSEHEGVGLDAWDGEAEDGSIRMCKLDELSRIGWDGLSFVSEAPEGWENFAAIRVGSGVYFTTYRYTLEAPSCPPGSVLALGNMMPGPGGIGQFALEPSLVVGASFSGWLLNLELWQWQEFAERGVGDLPTRTQLEVIQYYLALNPNMNLGLDR